MVLDWDMGGSSCVRSGLDKNYQEKWQIIMMIIELMISGVDSHPPGRNIFIGNGYGYIGVGGCLC